MPNSFCSEKGHLCRRRSSSSSCSSSSSNSPRSPSFIPSGAHRRMLNSFSSSGPFALGLVRGCCSSSPGPCSGAKPCVKMPLTRPVYWNRQARQSRPRDGWAFIVSAPGSPVRAIRRKSQKKQNRSGQASPFSPSGPSRPRHVLTQRIWRKRQKSQTGPVHPAPSSPTARVRRKCKKKARPPGPSSPAGPFSPRQCRPRGGDRGRGRSLRSRGLHPNSPRTTATHRAARVSKRAAGGSKDRPS